MSLGLLDHFTIRCVPQDLPRLLAFYQDTLGLVPGDRPVMPFPGHWLYSDGHPVVHLFGNLQQRAEGPTGALDHISFKSRGLQAMMRHLCECKVEFGENVLPDARVHQLFLFDPFGLKVELTYYLDEEAV
ncbi:MAG: glyoxalase [Burkholderiales bacterium]|nr:glyoxalase [Burkholderiales bacterium]